ncbi:MAG TPA: efflux RND transporter periplasmic adaptor subunit [Myxococcota bacterium]|jgi:RND family efflux transporter MFP subunit|nr:efflux RND transporter periplasmic adaptor subunit [Myxococcota bacterium]
MPRRAAPRASLAALAALVLAGGCSGKGGAGGGGPASGAPGGAPKDKRFPVEVALVAAHTVDYTLSAVGSVEAFEHVRVTARVAGVVERVLFAEGDVVKAGQALAEIEPERFRLAAASAHAKLDKALAAEADAKRVLERREALKAKMPDGVSDEELESTRAKAAAAAAETADARAALALAELNLRDAFVRAPLAGTIETRDVATGQYLSPGTVLATLVRTDPLLLRFAVAEKDAPRLATGMSVDFVVRGRTTAMKATITHVGEAADPASRMVPVTARIELAAATAPAGAPAGTSPGTGKGTGAGTKADPPVDPPRPGSFAEVTARVGGTTDAPAIPETSVRPSERGFLAFVVTDGKAHERTLTLGLRTGDGSVEVRAGLTVGETVVVRGAEALYDGAAVNVVGGGKDAKDRKDVDANDAKDAKDAKGTKDANDAKDAPATGAATATATAGGGHSGAAR